MGQEFFINSQGLEDKVRQLLPSQGGSGAGIDLSGSTQIIPIIDLTESAQGGNTRVDLQTALSFTTSTPFLVANAETTLVNNTGYWRVFGTMTTINVANVNTNHIILSDGTTQKIILNANCGLSNSGGQNPVLSFDFIVFLKAGESLIAKSTVSNLVSTGCTRQIADIDGNLVNP